MCASGIEKGVEIYATNITNKTKCMSINAVKLENGKSPETQYVRV
jgi:hypothetical protein